MRVSDPLAGRGRMDLATRGGDVALHQERGPFSWRESAGKGKIIEREKKTNPKLNNKKKPQRMS